MGLAVSREKRAVICAELKKGFPAFFQRICEIVKDRQQVFRDEAGRQQRAQDYRQRVWAQLKAEFPEYTKNLKREYCGGILRYSLDDYLRWIFYRAYDRVRDRERRRLQRQHLCCQQCSKPLDASRNDARYCSPACKQAAYRKRGADIEGTV